MSRFSKIVCIVLDGVGVGEAPDADRFGDTGSNSLGNTARHVGALRLPVLGGMGLGNLTSIAGVDPRPEATAAYGVMSPASPGKDSIAGHWELMGCVLDVPFPTYAEGFPGDVIRAFERAIGRSVIGNRPASGTAIIQEIGEEHVRTGRPIVYTSQDSVFQVAAHEDVISVSELYGMCRTARAQLRGPNGVARVIARPFAGEPGAYHRTPRRRDFSLEPPAPTILDALVARDERVLAIGKINDLFSGRGISTSIGTKNNREGTDATLRAAIDESWAFIFTNLVDFDTMWGHRNDPRAYALGLEEFDSFLGELVKRVSDDTLVLITSDHGNDPTMASTDHSREQVPLLAYHNALGRGIDLGVRDTFADVAKTVADNFRLTDQFSGTSFLGQL